MERAWPGRCAVGGGAVAGKSATLKMFKILMNGMVMRSLAVFKENRDSLIHRVWEIRLIEKEMIFMSQGPQKNPVKPYRGEGYEGVVARLEARYEEVFGDDF